MSRNFEIKLRCDDLEAIGARALAAHAVDHGSLVQIDTFFHVASGRLKLREINGDRAELIAYSRADIASAKVSDYVVAPVTEPSTMLAALKAACGVSRVVHKRRTLLLWRNVRIHLDRVDGLGDFVELESVVGEVDETAARANLDELLEVLELKICDAVAVAYADLLEGVTL